MSKSPEQPNYTTIAPGWYVEYQVRHIDGLETFPTEGAARSWLVQRRIQDGQDLAIPWPCQISRVQTEIIEE